MNGTKLDEWSPNARRALVLTLIFGAIATALFMFAVGPAESELTRQRKKLSALDDKVRLMNLNLAGGVNAKKKLAELDTQLARYRAAELTPLLDSYAMRARSILNPLALGAGLTETDYNEEKPFLALPLPKGILPKRLHARATIRMTAVGSYQSAVSFLLRLEKEHPLVSLQSLTITQSNDSVTEQNLTFIFEWPTKGAVTRK